MIHSRDPLRDQLVSVLGILTHLPTANKLPDISDSLNLMDDLMAFSWEQS
jgi:hypothetical protein